MTKKDKIFYFSVCALVMLSFIFGFKAKAQCTKNIATFSGGGKLELIKHATDFPSTGKTTFYYKFWASTPKDLSHFDVFVGTCLTKFYGGGTYTNTVDTSGLDYNSCWKLGQDGSVSGKPWVMKYDCGVKKGDSLQGFFVLNDTFGVTKNDALLKYGTTVVYNSICAPHIQCATPVTFGHISVKNVKNSDEVSFTTFTETNNDTFIVEQSYDAIQWKNVGGVKGKRNSSERVDYSVKVNLYDHANNVRYYRVKQIDFDGKFDYSPVVKISSEPIVGFYPNPANAGQSVIFNLTNFDEFSESKLLVISPLGEVVFTKDFTGSNIFEVNDLTKGVYCVQIASRHFTKAQKLVIK